MGEGSGGGWAADARQRRGPKGYLLSVSPSFILLAHVRSRSWMAKVEAGSSDALRSSTTACCTHSPPCVMKDTELVDTGSAPAARIRRQRRARARLPPPPLDTHTQARGRAGTQARRHAGTQALDTHTQARRRAGTQARGHAGDAQQRRRLPPEERCLTRAPRPRHTSSAIPA